MRKPKHEWPTFTGKVKDLIIAWVTSPLNEVRRLNLSDYIKQNMGVNYTYISTQFKKREGKTIQRFMNEQRVEGLKLKLKEGRTLTQAALDLNYSSTAHASNDFKNLTGMNPTQWLKGIKQPEDQVKVAYSME